MPGKFTDVRVHFIWSTLERRSWIRPEMEQELYRYLGGIFRNKKSVLIAAGGTTDHIHLYASLASTITLAEIVNAAKSNSTGWIREAFPNRRSFAWQRGYGAFSVSRSVEEGVIRYIANQKVHHGKIDFKQEFITFLRKHGIEYDERYLWD